MDIARTSEATINDMKSFEQQGASTPETNIDAISQNSSSKFGKCGLNHGRKCPAYGARCRKCNQWNHWQQVCRNKQTQDRKTKTPFRQQFEEKKPQDKTRHSKVNVVGAEANNDFEELLFETIQIDSSSVDGKRDEAFAKISLKIPEIDHPNPMLKIKVDTGAQGNVLPLRIYSKIFPDHIDDDGLPTGTARSQTKLTAYNGTPIPQHGVCSIRCSHGDKETDAVFYVADVDGPAVCGLPTSCKLN